MAKYSYVASWGRAEIIMMPPRRVNLWTLGAKNFGFLAASFQEMRKNEIYVRRDNFTFSWKFKKIVMQDETLLLPFRHYLKPLRLCLNCTPHLYVCARLGSTWLFTCMLVSWLTKEDLKKALGWSESQHSDWNSIDSSRN